MSTSTVYDETSDDIKDVFTLEDKEVVDLVNDELKHAKNLVHSFRKEAEQDDMMTAGWQWEPEDLQLLKEDSRPAVTFNRIKPIVDVVKGSEINNRQEIRFVPRHPEVAQVGALSDLATEAVKWAMDLCQGDDERSLAFGDLLVRGMGWTEVRVDFDSDLDGRIQVERVDGMEMFWDPQSRKQNLEDARWVCRKKWMRRKDIYRIWPDKKDEILVSNIDPMHDDYPSVVEWVTPIAYRDEDDMRFSGTPRGYLPIMQFQWWEFQDVYRTPNPDSEEGELLEFSKQEFSRLRSRLLKLKRKVPPYVKQQKRIYFQAFVAGDVLLEKKRLPVQGHFSFKCMTGFWDPKEKIWFGLVRGLIDPQRWANKWLSQGLHIVNANAKGGLIAEVDAFENPRKAEDQWSNPNKITFVKPGGLAKIKEKDRGQFPDAIATMMQYAISALRDVSGVSVEMLGASEGDQPALTMRQRQTQGMTILATLFNSLTRYRKEEARLSLSLIREFIADGRLIRVAGEYNAQSIPLLREPLSIDYDIVVDENPKNPNTKMEVWGMLTQLAPALLKFNMFAPELLDYSPLPASLVGKLKERMQQAQQAAAQAPPAKPGDDPREVEARIEKIKADAILQIQRAKALAKEAELDEKEILISAALERTKMEKEPPPPPQPESDPTAGLKQYSMLQALAHKQESHDTDQTKKLLEMNHRFMQPQTGTNIQ